MAADELREQAKLMLLQKQYRSARDVCTRAMEQAPGSYKLLHLRALANGGLQDYAAVLEDTARILATRPTRSDAWHLQGDAHMHLKDYAKAAKAFSQGLTLNPADRAIQQGFWDSMVLMSQSRLCSDTAAPVSAADGTPVVNSTVDEGDQGEEEEGEGATPLGTAPSGFAMGGSLLKSLLSNVQME